MTDRCPSARWLLFHKDLLVLPSKEPFSLPEDGDISRLPHPPLRSGMVPRADESLFWGELDPDEPIPHGTEAIGLRDLWALAGEELFRHAGTAFQVMNWRRNTRFCSRCGDAMVPSEVDAGLLCPSCGFASYPTLSPAVIVAVVRDGKLLLARNSRFPKGRHSVLAGFVEPGETLEETVRREIREEVAIEVKDIAYFDSQPWPFPHSLMLGFTARWASGEIRPDGTEIEEAGWFTPEDMPDIPPSISISRRLIEHWRSGALR